MEFKLTAYEGPLDLLLKLIIRNEIDIYDIPISQLTAQYLEEVAQLPPDMEQLSEFLVMAATLLEIKSRMLLPRARTDEDEEPGDPREALVQQLLAYSQATAIAGVLEELTPEGGKFTGPGDRQLLQQIKDAINSQPEMDMITVNYLRDVFHEVITRKESRKDVIRAGYGEMPREKFSVTEKVSFIGRLLNQEGRLNLFDLFFNCRSRNEMVVTFLALLEMVRRGTILTIQPSAFSDVEVKLCQA